MMRLPPNLAQPPMGNDAWNANPANYGQNSKGISRAPNPSLLAALQPRGPQPPPFVNGANPAGFTPQPFGGFQQPPLGAPAGVLPPGLQQPGAPQPQPFYGGMPQPGGQRPGIPQQPFMPRPFEGGMPGWSKPTFNPQPFEGMGQGLGGFSGGKASRNMGMGLGNMRPTRNSFQQY